MSEIELKKCPSPECKDIDMEIYCTKCGACGIEGCCPPDKCKCLHGEEYKATYKELLDENEQLQTHLNLAVSALEKLRDCDWVITLPDRMDAVREIAQTALNQIKGETKCSK